VIISDINAKYVARRRHQNVTFKKIHPVVSCMNATQATGVSG
jgi:hypothetical protein